MSSEPQHVAASMLRTPPEDESLLARVEDLQLYFDTNRGVVKALDGVNFDIYEGEILALVGETGCGKSITARSFLQLVPSPPGRYPSGRILLRSEESCGDCSGSGCGACHETGRRFDDMLAVPKSRMSRIRGKRIAMIFQDPKTALNPSIVVKEQVAESILAHRSGEVLLEAGVDPTRLNPIVREFVRNEADTDRSFVKSLLASVPPLRKHKRAIRSVIDDRVVDVLRKTQIPSPHEAANSYPHELSGGQQQRVMIAMALVAKPDLLIADEATTALDVTTQARILELIRDIQTENNTSLLYITHDLDLVSDIADRIAVMYAGSIAEIGDVDQVYATPLHPYTEGLIGSIPSEARLGKRLREIDGSIPDLTDPPEGCRFCTRCPEVMDHCCDEDPPVVEERPGQLVACHLYPSGTPRADRAVEEAAEE